MSLNGVVLLAGEAGRPGQNEGSGALPESADLWGLEGNGDARVPVSGGGENSRMWTQERKNKQ